MADEFDEEAKAVSRSVASTEHDGEKARAVVLSRTYATDIADLWEAITSAERIPRWFMPVSGKLELGGRFQLEGNAGGTIERCEPPHALGVTWEFGGGIGWVNVSLEEEGDSATRLTLEHIGHEDEAYLQFWDQFGPGAVGVGWDLGLLGLALHLRTGEAVPKETDFMQSDEGKRFTAASNEGWRAANAAFGTPKEAAEGAAERTLAFYTGAPPPDNKG